MAAIAQLLGLNPAPPARCRVLELACGDGANLMAMATALPQSAFVGIDLAARAIAAGRELCSEVGLQNLNLLVGDASAAQPELGEFDYVIAHGVYSWVDEPVRDGLLAKIKAHLAPTGVAFVSFSCYPGAYFRELAREVMSFHTGGLSEPTARLEQGIGFLRFIHQAHAAKSAYAAALEQEIARVSRADPGYVFHDDFSEHNTPVYFAAFASHLGHHGLQYLADASFDHFFDRRVPGNVREQIARFAAGDCVAEQQYLDFVRGTPFRQVLICHDSLTVERRLVGTRLLPLFVRAPLQPMSDEPDLLGPSKVCFKARNGAEMETDEQLAKALLFELSQSWPKPRSVGDLLDAALGRIHRPRTDDDYTLRILTSTILSAAASQGLSLWAGEAPFATSCGERPLASPLARVQARHSDLVTTLRSATVRLADRAARHLLTLADGTRAREELLLALRRDLADVREIDLEALTPRALDDTLQGLAERGFMLG